MDEPGLSVDWNNVTNEIRYPLPWWLGPRHRHPESDTDDPLIEHPGLLYWVEAVVRAVVDRPGWAPDLARKKVQDVGIDFHHEHSGDSAGLMSGGEGLVFWGVAVPMEIVETQDLHRAAGWLVRAALEGLCALADRLRIARPVLRHGAAVSLADLYVDRHVRDVAQLTRIADLTTPDDVPRILIPTGTAGPDVDPLPLEPVASPLPGRVGTLRAGRAPRTPEPPFHFDFRALQYPAYLEEIARRSEIRLVVWVRIARPGDAPAVRDRFAAELRRLCSIAAIDPYVSGRDGDVLWSAFATRSDVPAVERDRVDIEFGSELYEDADEPPERVALDPDNGHAAAVGRTGDGRQYFFTAPYSLAEDDPADVTYYLALYLFDLDGRFVEADIRRLGRAGTFDDEIDTRTEAELMGRLAEPTVERIVVAPFAVERFGVTFGLVASETFGEWRVNAMPGDYMEFYPPWDSGIYDT